MVKLKENYLAANCVVVMFDVFIVFGCFFAASKLY